MANLHKFPHQQKPWYTSMCICIGLKCIHQPSKNVLQTKSFHQKHGSVHRCHGSHVVKHLPHQTGQLCPKPVISQAVTKRESDPFEVDRRASLTGKTYIASIREDQCKQACLFRPSEDEQYMSFKSNISLRSLFKTRSFVTESLLLMQHLK